jgi:hypothetical protein
MKRIHKDVRENVARFGWHRTGVGAGDDPYLDPPMCYTVGLWQTYRHPEVICVGLGYDVLAELVLNIGVKVKKGTQYLTGRLYAGVVTEPYRVAFLEVTESQHKRRLGSANTFYKGLDDVGIMQCVWPDQDGIFPWQIGCQKEVVAHQPIYGTHAKEYLDE